MAAGTSSSEEIESGLVTPPLLRIEGVGSSISVGGQSTSSVSCVSVTCSDAESIEGVNYCTFASCAFELKVVFESLK